jgi:hypothetical protein
VLLDYVAIESRSLASPILYDIVQTVVRAHQAVEAGTLDAELAGAVLQSVATLRALAAPATAETITASRTVRPRTLTLPAVIVTGATIVLSGLAAFNASQQTSLSRLIVKQNQAALELYLGSQEAPGPEQIASPPMLAALNEFSLWNQALAEQTRALQRWAAVVGLGDATRAAVTVPPVPAAIEPGTLPAVIRSQMTAFQQIRAAAVDAEQTNDLLAGSANGYVLPGLYALLGSMTFGLRKDLEAIRTSTLSPRRRTVQRNILAVLAGVTVGLFTSQSASANLTALGLAFLAGYGAEIFFGRLDGLINVVFAPAHSPAATRAAELDVLTRAVNASVTSVFAPAFVAYNGTLGVDITDESGASAVTVYGQDAAVLFPRAGAYRVTVWFVPQAAPPQGAAQVKLTVEGGPPPEGSSVPFEVRADLGFATTPLRRQEVAVDPRTPAKVDLGVLQVAADGLPDGPIRPNYPISVAVYQHGQRCTTCVIVPAPNG